MLRTYQWELIFASSWLAIVTILTTDFTSIPSIAAQFFSFFGVIFSFCHMQVGSRLEESESKQVKPSVACYQKMTYYLIAKEMCWLLAFGWMGAWTAIAGQPLFLFYPVWRRWWLKKKRSG